MGSGGFHKRPNYIRCKSLREEAGSLSRLELIHFCLMTAQDQGRNSVIESRHVNQVDQKRQQLGGDQPDVAGTLEEIVRPAINGERAGEIEEEKAWH